MSEKTSKNVEIIADGSNQIKMVFPDEMEFSKGKRSISVEEVVKLLSGQSDAEVEGQICWPHCRSHCALTAVSLRG